MRTVIRLPILVPAGTALLLAGCGWLGNDAAGSLGDDGPPTLATIADQIPVDPYLAGQNRAAGAAFASAADGPVPIVDRGPDAVASARADALRLVGGPGRMMKAPEPGEVASGVTAEDAIAAAERSATAPGGDGDCAARARRSLQWAAQLPAMFPVYPRGAVQDAAGTDAAGCSLRMVNFVTPVPVADVMNFYFSRARVAGFSARRTLHEGADVLGGLSGGSSYLVYARRLPSGNTEVDLVTGGS